MFCLAYICLSPAISVFSFISTLAGLSCLEIEKMDQSQQARIKGLLIPFLLVIVHFFAYPDLDYHNDDTLLPPPP
jgi:hypothetical protein